MKMIKGFAIFTCLIASSLVVAGDMNKSAANLLNASTKEFIRLKSKEAILRAIMDKTESIQLKDGTVIDFRDLEGFQPTKGQDHNFNGLMEVFRAVEGGGTGAGG